MLLHRLCRRRTVNAFRHAPVPSALASPSREIDVRDRARLLKHIGVPPLRRYRSEASPTYRAFSYTYYRVLARGKDGAPQACPSSARADELRAGRHLTVTVIAAEVVDFPVLSVATAVSTCWPTLTFLVFHWTCHGELFEAPISVLST